MAIHFVGRGIPFPPPFAIGRRMPAFAREGYRKTDVELGDLVETLTYPGFLRMALKHWRTGWGQLWRSFSKRAFVRALQRLLPEIRAEHLEAISAGVRAQLVAHDGSLVDDMVKLPAL
jgi:L-2-hydroxyglutarate oxidase